MRSQRASTAIDHRWNRGELRKVARDGETLDALAFEVRACLVQFRLLARGERDFRAHLAQCFGHLQADSARAAGDDGDLAVEAQQIP